MPSDSVQFAPPRLILRNPFTLLSVFRISPEVNPLTPASVSIALCLGLFALAVQFITDARFLHLPRIYILLLAAALVLAISSFSPPTRITRVTVRISIALAFQGSLCLCAVLACYSAQRLALPLRDDWFLASDRAMGFEWLTFAKWVDGRPDLAFLFRQGYATIGIQLSLPLIVLSLTDDMVRYRAYLLACAAVLAATAAIGALLPATGAYAIAQHETFRNISLYGATPLDDLWQWREPGPIRVDETPGPLISFPSFHAAVAFMTPLALRRIRPLLVVRLVVEPLLLAGAITEGCQ
jgi:hypothetical protein